MKNSIVNFKKHLVRQLFM